MTASASTASALPTWGPLAPANPFLGPLGTSTMHGDAGSSDATPLAGPGSGALSVDPVPLAAACPTLLEGSDGLVLALCTSILGQVPTVHLIDTSAMGTGSLGSLGGSSSPAASVAQLELPKGSLLGGVYAYLDNADRLVAVDGNRQLVRVQHEQTTNGSWRLFVDQSVDLSGSIPDGDNVTGLAPDWQGNVWFATGAGRVGRVDVGGVTRTLALPVGEEVQNSISTSVAGTAVATTHALYQLSADTDGTPKIDWRAAYDRGSARKPGQLSWGTGSTPTYFGPNGSDYLTIVDSADTQVSLLVYRASTGETVCSQTVLTTGGPGSENSPIGIGNSVFVASTYGYPYPTVPAGAGPAVPASAPFVGGMTRVDVDVDGEGCHTVWNNDARSSAVPHLSTADGNLYTVVRQGLPSSSDKTSPLDEFAFAVIDPNTGNTLAMRDLPGTMINDTLQMSALIDSSGDYLQGTISGVIRVSGQ
ncbi:hypothetical protein [Rhodococcus sp. IEGM 1379]|uniref:hypothetical protein n=1 Tax=Rhodococcus sp. IEGM 1379 TaxID=3047086 RepID=UPI0024B7BBD0|nr:hypothetical protein [Rhodococcus sp. IEGM 1379]MDI9913695.1 hypothetical protein [Rhodococcus sp. IEGM 1379]